MAETEAARPVRIGVIGCGVISGIYLKNLQRFPMTEVVACADIIPERAEARAREFGVPRACTNDEIYDDPEIEMVVNLTPPRAHYEVSEDALESGKRAYSEKPLAVTREEGLRLMETATGEHSGFGAAPDTFLGGGLQTCRKLLDDGAIGTVIGATAFMTSHGPESWHPDPAFFYKPGGGPMLDMGPYYLTALVSLLGPIKRVTGSVRASFPERVIGSEPRKGLTITVEVPTHVSGVMDFASGAIGTILTSFDVWASNLPRIELYGTEGTLSVPDPNGFGGVVRLRRAGDKEWQDVPLTHGFTENSRGIGALDMAYALRNGRKARCDGRLAYHVLEAMHGFHESSDEGCHYLMHSSCDRPAPLPTGLPDDALDG